MFVRSLFASCGLILTRQSTMFQEDIFPPTKEEKAYVTADQWLAGQNAVVTKFSLKVNFLPYSLRQLAIQCPAIHFFLRV